MQEQLRRYMDDRKMYSMEGQRGVNNLKRIVTEVCGYDDKWAGTLANFFEDNPGAIEAVIEWIGSRRNPDWTDNLEGMVGAEEEDPVGDLAPPEETASESDVDPHDFVVRGYK